MLRRSEGHVPDKAGAVLGTAAPSVAFWLPVPLSGAVITKRCLAMCVEHTCGVAKRLVPEDPRLR